MAHSKEVRREYRARNREKVLAQQRAFYERHPEKRKEYESHRNKEHREQWQKAYKAEHKEHLLECAKVSGLKRYWAARIAIVEALGGKCGQCGFIDIRALEVHHKNGGGSAERRAWGNGRVLNDYRYYRGLLSHLDDIELLCSNCHSILSWDLTHPDGPVIDKEYVLAFRREA